MDQTNTSSTSSNDETVDENDVAVVGPTQLEKKQFNRSSSPLRQVQEKEDEPEPAPADIQAAQKKTKDEQNGKIQVKARTKMQSEVVQYMKDYKFMDNKFPKETYHHVQRKYFHMDEVKEGATTGHFLLEAREKCVICHEAESPTGETELTSCHGQMNGEKSGSERIKPEERPFRPCRSMFHLQCIMKYNAGDFMFQYAARPECQYRFLCPLHCCSRCNSQHQRQSAYQPDLMECALCLRSFHWEKCYPMGAVDFDVAVDMGNLTRAFEMMVCPAHHVPGNDKNKNKKSNKVIKKHIEACSALECLEKGPEPLIECRTCVRSFHRGCFEVEKIDGEDIPKDMCEYCICNDEIPVDTPVLALWEKDRLFYLARVVSWQKYPSKNRKNESNYERPGYTVVQWLKEGKDENSQMTIIPVKHVAPLTKTYLFYASPEEHDFWAHIHDTFNTNTKSAAHPTYYKEVAHELKTSKVTVEGKSLTKSESHDSGCHCKGDPRCISESCSLVADLHECPPECGPGCQNRKISEKFIHPHIERRETEQKGFGVFATEDIGADEYLSEYVGELIDAEETKERLRIISLSRDFQANHYMMGLSSRWTIDASKYGNISRYINHSCDPNSGSFKYHMYISRRSSDECLYEPRNIIKTIRPIKKGEEITFSYTSDGKSFPPCKCQAVNCNGVMSLQKAATPQDNSKKSKMIPKVKKATNKRKNSSGTGPGSAKRANPLFSPRRFAPSQRSARHLSPKSPINSVGVPNVTSMASTSLSSSTSTLAPSTLTTQRRMQSPRSSMSVTSSIRSTLRRQPPAEAAEASPAQREPQSATRTSHEDQAPNRSSVRKTARSFKPKIE